MFIFDENNIPEVMDGLKDVFDIKEKRIAELENENKALREKARSADTSDDICKKLLKENQEYKDLYMQEIIKVNEARFENDRIKNENERLINRLHDYESQIAEMAEKATNPDYVKFLEMAKKFQECNVGVLTELEEATRPERNVTIIENQYNNEYHYCECPFCNKEDEDI